MNMLCLTNILVEESWACCTGENVYVQVSLDGTVRSSGVGVPPWDRWLGDLAPLDDIRSRLTKQ